MNLPISVHLIVEYADANIDMDAKVPATVGGAMIAEAVAKLMRAINDAMGADQ